MPFAHRPAATTGQIDQAMMLYCHSAHGAGLLPLRPDTFGRTARDSTSNGTVSALSSRYHALGGSVSHESPPRLDGSLPRPPPILTSGLSDRSPHAPSLCTSSGSCRWMHQRRINLPLRDVTPVGRVHHTANTPIGFGTCWIEWCQRQVPKLMITHLFYVFFV